MLNIILLDSPFVCYTTTSAKANHKKKKKFDWPVIVLVIVTLFPVCLYTTNKGKRENKVKYSITAVKYLR